MTAATNVVFAEVHWTPALMLQAEDRVHRIGQENSVNIYYLYGNETMDEIIFPILTKKSYVIAETLDAKRAEYHLKMKARTGLNDDELEKLEREAKIRQKESEIRRKSKSRSTENSNKHLNKYVSIESKHLEDISFNDGSSSIVKSISAINTPCKTESEETWKPTENPNSEFSNTDLLKLVEESVVNNKPPIPDEARLYKPKQSSIIRDESSDESESEKESSNPVVIKTDIDKYLEKLQADDDFALIASENALNKLQSSKIYAETNNSLANDIDMIQSLSKPLPKPPKLEQSCDQNQNSQTNVNDIQDAFIKHKISSHKGTKKKEFKTLEESVKESSYDRSASNIPSEIRDADDMTRLLKGEYDTEQVVKNNEKTMDANIYEMDLNDQEIIEA